MKNRSKAQWPAGAQRYLPVTYPFLYLSIFIAIQTLTTNDHDNQTLPPDVVSLYPSSIFQRRKYIIHIIHLAPESTSLFLSPRLIFRYNQINYDSPPSYCIPTAIYIILFHPPTTCSYILSMSLWLGFALVKICALPQKDDSAPVRRT